MLSRFTLHFILLSSFLSVLLKSSSGNSVPDFSALDKWLLDNFDHHNKRLIELISIPSVSADPKRASEIRRAAKWVQTELQEIGLDNIHILETAGHPSVYADWLHADPSAPTVLIYAHYDVQPEDPVSLWKSSPFQSRIEHDRMYARGACDDKGSLFAALVAIRAYLKSTGSLPVNIKLLLEGEEEIGSPHLRTLLNTYKDLLKADYSLSADGGQISPDIPGLCLGLRGMISMEIKVTTANTDMHSGMYGGGVQNPIHALVHLLDSLRNPDTEEILVEGYYDDVDVISSDAKNDLSKYPVNFKDQLRINGVNESIGEKGFSFYERTWLRPSLEIIGIKGGFQGDGIKTVLPAEASAKLSSRLVSSQSATKSVAQLRGHIEREASKLSGVVVSLQEMVYCEAVKISKSNVGISVAETVLAELYGREPCYYYRGTTIPAIALLKEMMGLETVVLAFQHPDERTHAPNEFVRLSSLRRGQQAYVRMFWELKKAHAKIEKDEL